MRLPARLSWEECLPYIEFAYNRAIHSATKKSPFEVVYGINPTTPLDLAPRPMTSHEDFDANTRAQYIRELHDQVRQQLEKRTEQYVRQANKGRKEVLFEVGELVWVHLLKDRFPSLRQSKLKPRADGPFQVLEKINDNAYRIELPDRFGVHDIFNVSDLSPFYAGSELVDDLVDSGSNPFQWGEDDVIPTSNTDTQDLGDTQDGVPSPITPQLRALPPLTRSRARLLDQVVLSEALFESNQEVPMLTLIQEGVEALQLLPPSMMPSLPPLEPLPCCHPLSLHSLHHHDSTYWLIIPPCGQISPLIAFY